MPLKRCPVPGLLLLLCLLAPAFSSGQAPAPWSGFALESNLMAGKVLKHSTKFKAPVPDLSTAYELNFVQQTWGKKPWHQRRHYPLVGVGLAYTVYGIDSIYGRCLSLYPNLQVPIIRGDRLEWTFRMGFGVGYVSRHFTRAPDWDTLNNAISSHFNNFTLLSTDLRYHVNEHLDLQAGLNFSHISNAALKQPNLGVNMYGAHIGMRYYPVTSRPARIMRKMAPLKNRWLAQARLGLAFNEAGYADGPIFPTRMASVYASRRWQGRNKVFAGLDYSYHEKVEAFLKNNEIHIGEEGRHSWKSAVFVGNEFLFGRVGIMLQVGVYLKDTYLKTDPYYQKLGGNFYLVQKEKGPLKELFLSVLLKTHQVQAELAEAGIGFGF